MRVSNALARAALAVAAAFTCSVAAAADEERVDANTRGRRLGADTQWTSTPGVPWALKGHREAVRARRRDLQAAATCKRGCDALPCPGGCQSAFARCNYDVPLCFTNSTGQVVNATVQWGWSNPVKCIGGSIACDLWIGALGCNTTASSSQVIGAVTIDTDTKYILYEITNDSFRMSSVQMYVGPTEVPVVDGSMYSISPEDYTIQSWLDPKAKTVTIGPVEELVPSMLLVAHAYVCPVDSANEIPEVWVPLVNATDPLCPIRAPTLCSNATPTPTPAPFLFTTSNLFQPAPTDLPSIIPSSITVEGGRSLQLNESTCPFKCGDLSCDGGCLGAFAFCPGATCLGPDPEGLATWGHSNPINCTGGLLQCELWTGDDCNHTNGEMVGRFQIDTDRNMVTYDISDDRTWEVSSASIYVGPSSLFERYEQHVWYDPNQRNAIVEMYPDIHAGAFIIAQALVCPVAFVISDLAAVPLNDTIKSCPVPSKVPCPSTLPTSALATESPAKSPEALVTTVPTAKSPEHPTLEPLIVPLALPPLESPVEAPQTQPNNATPPSPPQSPTRAPVRFAPPTFAPVKPSASPVKPRALPTGRPILTRKPSEAPKLVSPTERPVQRTPVPTDNPTRLVSAGPTEHPTEYPTPAPSLSAGPFSPTHL